MRLGKGFLPQRHRGAEGGALECGAVRRFGWNSIDPRKSKAARSAALQSPFCALCASVVNLIFLLAAAPLQAERLEERLPSPTAERTAAGVPGPAYWQQQVDYVIEVTLDEPARRIDGQLRLTYHNRSPSSLDYLWLHLDGNLGQDGVPEIDRFGAPNWADPVPADAFRRWWARRLRDDGLVLHTVTDAEGKALVTTATGTLLRVDLPTPLAPGGQQELDIRWSLPFLDGTWRAQRGGYEAFPSGGDIFQVVHWYPRAAVFSDVRGWHVRPYLGPGEFAAEFGNFDVTIDVPADHVVAATGVLVNPESALTAEQQRRRARLLTGADAELLVTEAEARAAMANPSPGRRRWHFRAENVRDVAWTSSRRFIWESQRVAVGEKTVEVQVLYPPEASSMWANTVREDSVHLLRQLVSWLGAYPFPSLIVANGAEPGMEYPMLAMVSDRAPAGEEPEAWAIQYLRRVVAHEIAHNWFPMWVNSDEREWGWLDEGLVTFLEWRLMREWDEASRAEQADLEASAGWSLVRAGRDAIMTLPDAQKVLGYTTYDQPGLSLHLLREVVLGPERFDAALRDYVTRWGGRRAEPADFFRTMNQGGGAPLDGFWLDWFWSDRRFDYGIAEVRWGPAAIDDAEVDARAAWETGLPVAERPHLIRPAVAVISIINHGGLRLPIDLEVVFADGTVRREIIPLEAWLQDPDKIDWILPSASPPVEVYLDPQYRLPDVDPEDNTWRGQAETLRWELSYP